MAREIGVAGIDFVVAHTHSDGDHAAWDSEFARRPRTTIVKLGLADVKALFGFAALARRRCDA